MSAPTPERKSASEATDARWREAARESAGFDPADEIRATRGRLAEPAPRVVTGRFGHDVWNLDDYAFMNDVEAPATVHPGLWRQGRLNNEAGLFEVAPTIYQVRGLDISNVTFIEGATGWIVIDPLSGGETAGAALAMVNAHLGERPVRAVIYTHSHWDHFGGVLGVTTALDVEKGRVEVIAPEGFLREAVSENILAGTAMLRRATYMFGALLAKDARGHVDTGLGKGVPALPSAALVAPTREITLDVEALEVDGVSLVFQLTPGTEAPSEMNVYLPAQRALCVAENCTATMHNLYTLRGAQVRDALAWSKYVDDALTNFGELTDVLFASHHWPRWGRDDVAAYLASQRDAYRFVHDQTLRLANHGLTMNEIAETLSLPEGLAASSFNHGYYGTLSHNAKAVYQRYLGWFDANPAHLNPHPPVAAATRYVAFMGGAEEVLAKARDSFAAGDYRWVVEVVNHVVFADPSNEAARLLQADALEQLGYQSESGPWRDFYLSGAMELRANGTALRDLPGNALNPSLLGALTPAMLFDVLGVRLNALLAGDLEFVARVDLSSPDETWTFGVRHGVVHARAGAPAAPTLRLRAALRDFAAFVGGRDPDATLEVVEGDATLWTRFRDALDTFAFGFELVLP
ncbi:MAG: MBL fold metallo-hydrolase [Acidobacteriota bacterium]|nr:MBL fold metallo-hydrolase [Acidobacteriota bacterium]MDE3044701.1 MBL fold metallo-hydrolase [Acidobacteriota bacterium]